MSQSQCGRSTSQSGYRSSLWWAVTPANWLIGRESISQRIAPLIPIPCDTRISCGISVLFKTLSPSERQVTHALLTRPPLRFEKQASQISVRLACVRHAASVRPEPGSNSLKIVFNRPFGRLNHSQSFECSFRALSALAFLVSRSLSSPVGILSYPSKGLRVPFLVFVV